jgi:hypothetical protein
MLALFFLVLDRAISFSNLGILDFITVLITILTYNMQ